MREPQPVLNPKRSPSASRPGYGCSISCHGDLARLKERRHDDFENVPL